MASTRDVAKYARSPIKRPREQHRPFKERKSLDTRVTEYEIIRYKFPTKIPAIVERYGKENILPFLDKTKYLVPQELTMCQFATIIRNRLSIGTTQAIYFLIAKRFVPTMSMTMLEIYHNFMDQDGFLYVCYASEEWFGGRNSWGQGE